MSVDKNYCMSSYLAFRYIEDDDKDFYEGMKHCNTMPRAEQIQVRTVQDIDRAIGMQMTDIRGGVNSVSSCPAGWTQLFLRPIWAAATPIRSAS